MNRRLIGIVLTMMMLALFSHGQAVTAEASALPDTATVPQPVLVKDINASKLGSSSNANGFVAVGGVTFFSANDGVHGQELWKSDGTEAGTVSVKDINPNGDSYPQNLTGVGGVLYFSVSDPANGISLWKSDGTDAGTVLVKDITSTVGSSLNSLTNVGGVLYFMAGDGVSGYSVWKSDGTAAGTVVVKDAGPIAPGSTEYFLISNLTNVGNDLYFTINHQNTIHMLWKSNATGTELVNNIGPVTQIANLTDVGGVLYFVTYDPVSKYGIWKSDGTASGAVSVKNFGASQPFYLTNVNGVLYFSAYDGVNGQELWRSDPTAGAVLVKDINPTSSSLPNDLTNVGGVLYFTANDGTNGTALWKSDGTANGTVLVKGGAGISNLTSVGGALYFVANGTELWKSDATAGAVLVTNLGSASTLSVNVSNLTNAGGVLYFTASGVNGMEPWKSDGTAAGTMMLKQIFSGTGPSIEPRRDVNPVVNVNGVLYFTAISDLVDGLGLWKSDGTTAGTTLVKGFGVGKVSVSNLTNVNGVLYFVNNDVGIWKSDGTEVGTVLVKDFNAIGLTPSNLIDVNGGLYFSTYDRSNFGALWKSDGTDAGTIQMKLFGSGSAPTSLTNVGGVLYFSAGEGAMGTELWKSDGTETGTVQVKNIYTGDGNSSNPSNLTNVGGVLYFTATDAVNGTALWKSDGTDAGTVLVKVVTPVGGIPAFMFYSSANVNGVLYFTVFDKGYSLWKSDAASGAVLVTNFPAGSPYNITNVNGTLYFFYDSMTASGTELWKSDGTEAGTVVVKTVNLGISNKVKGDVPVPAPIPVKGLAKTVAMSGPRVGPSATLVEVNGVLYFTAYDAAHGFELWKSDGTADGTAMVMDIFPGAGSSYPASLINVNGALFFNADDGFHGNELWVLRMNSATALATGATPTTYGQSVTFTASVTSGATGTVTFGEGDTTYCAGVALDNSGKAACSTTSLGTGAHTITATYSGDGHYNGSNATVSQTVNQASSTTTVTTGMTTSTYGQSVTFTASVTSGATGTVTFAEGATMYCSAVVLDGNGKAACSTTALGAGSHTMTATYSGDGTYKGSNGTVGQSVVAAVLTVTADSKSRNYGSANPTMTATYSGFVNNDTQASLSGAPGITTSATTVSPAGNYPITITVGTLASGNYSFNFVNGIMAVSLSAAASGDINSDGKVDISDALMALQMAIGLSASTPTQLTAGDVAPLVNGKSAPDGTIDIADAMLILEKAVGLLNW
ncbi:ELWxxDGT repeat protein [Geotalea uraniireducens]|uniref:Dockerin domain-containing protein n=1 Tax=Geotalea uraniireducens (strain Rf4) TaxID=351605 RepID=A5GBT6_GEOUR|nr:ELWxxDGT repeat protein [Geotalea uraniireducens]ABQ24956.1 hypothetical protein Gura_0747 [Geotalea uraniireducens Rf4]